MNNEKRKELLDSLSADIELLSAMKIKYVDQQQYWIAAIIRGAEVAVRKEWNERFVDQAIENIKP